MCRVDNIYHHTPIRGTQKYRSCGCRYQKFLRNKLTKFFTTNHTWFKKNKKTNREKGSIRIYCAGVKSRLIFGLTSDFQWRKVLKGPERPCQKLKSERKANLLCLRSHLKSVIFWGILSIKIVFEKKIQQQINKLQCLFHLPILIFFLGLLQMILNLCRIEALRHSYHNLSNVPLCGQFYWCCYFSRNTAPVVKARALIFHLGISSGKTFPMYQ